MKIVGAELQQFMDAAWPGDDWYWDHDLFDDPVPDAVYDTNDIGGIYYQGRDVDPTDGKGYDLAALIRAWRKRRDYDVLTVTVPKARASEVRAAISALGVTVS